MVYLWSGPLQVVFRDGVRYAQLHVLAGQLHDEHDGQLVPDAELGEILLGLFQPASWDQAVGLALVLRRPLVLSAEGEREPRPVRLLSKPATADGRRPPARHRLPPRLRHGPRSVVGLPKRTGAGG
jgi:hypothetical protein